MDAQLSLPESASVRLEDLLRLRNCPVHVGTTLAADGRCDVCELVFRPARVIRDARVSELRRSLYR